MTDETNRELVTAYRLCFGSPAGQAVLVDLMKASRFRVSLVTDGEANTSQLLIALGRRELFVRIMTLLALTDEQLIALYGGQRLNLTEESET